jgi:hypothetical protein
LSLTPITPAIARAKQGAQIGILQSPLERGEREQNGDWLSFPPTASFPDSTATAEKIACPRFAADRILICSPKQGLKKPVIAPPSALWQNGRV